MTVMSAGDNIDAEIGARVHQQMWRQRVSQTVLGRVVGLDQSTISKKLRGTRPWYASELVAVARELGCSVSTFYGENGTSPTTTGPDGGQSLPHLDSNQKPFGLRLAAA